MLYWITQHFASRIVGWHVFSYLTFRAILATASALGLSLIIGPAMIAKLSRYQIGQVVPRTTVRRRTCPRPARRPWAARSSS